MTNASDGRDDWDYQPFRPLSRWASARVDTQLWDSTLTRLTAARDAHTPDVREDEVQRSLRAAALNTGALEGLHHADRGLTVTVVEEAAWQAVVDRVEGPEARSYMEAALDAFDLVFDVATQDQTLTEALVRRIHEVVTTPQDTYDAQTPLGRRPVTLPHGTYKTQPNHVEEPDGTKHAYAPPEDVAHEMRRLVGELRAEAAETVHPVLLAAFAHHAFVAVHPFADGNGRVARLLASIYTLRAASVPLMIWADQSLEYRAALKAADRGDPQPFVDFVLDRTVDAMNLMEDRLRSRQAERTIGTEADRRDAEERQIVAAERLWSELGRSLAQTASERPSVFATDTQEVTYAGGGSEFPYGRAHRLVATRGAVSRARTFVVSLPRSDTSALIVTTDSATERRSFRVSDFDPQLKAGAAEGLSAYVRRVSLEFLASFDD